MGNFSGILTVPGYIFPDEYLYCFDTLSNVISMLLSKGKCGYQCIQILNATAEENESSFGIIKQIDLWNPVKVGFIGIFNFLRMNQTPGTDLVNPNYQAFSQNSGSSIGSLF